MLESRLFGVFGGDAYFLNHKENARMPKRRGGPRPRWKKSKKPRENVWRPMDACPRESKLFEDYYRLQKVCPEDEFTQMIECLVGNGAVGEG